MYKLPSEIWATFGPYNIKCVRVEEPLDSEPMPHYVLASPELLALIESAKNWSNTKSGDDVLASQISLHEAANGYANSIKKDVE